MSYPSNDDYTTVSDADDYSSLNSFSVSLPKAPASLAYNMPRSYAPYLVHGGNKNVYVQEVAPSYNDLTGTGLTSYNTIARNIYMNNPQPVENITPLPGGMKSLNYNNFTDARFNMGRKAYL